MAMLDCRDLNPDPCFLECLNWLRIAEGEGFGGIVVPLTRMSEEKADIVHSFSPGWYGRYCSVGEKAFHVPASEPCIKVAAMNPRQICVFPRCLDDDNNVAVNDQTFAVFINTDDRRELAMSVIHTALLTYDGYGSVSVSVGVGENAPASLITAQDVHG
jgi:hypothetical protein